MYKITTLLLALFTLSFVGFSQTTQELEAAYNSNPTLDNTMELAKDSETSNPRKAIELYSEAINISVNDTGKAHELRGHFFSSLGNHIAAVADFEKVMDADNATISGESMEKMGDAFFNTGDAARACQIWNDALNNFLGEPSETISTKIAANCK